MMSEGLFGASVSHVGAPGVKLPMIAFHQLLVLGNGFDLECGLPTRFCHFFEPRLKALDEQDWKNTGKLEGLGYDATPTVWDLLLKSKIYAPWYNIEDAIHDLVVSAGDGTSAPTGIASKLIARIHELSETDYGKAGRFDGNAPVRSDEDELLDNATEFIAISCVDKLRKDDAPWTPQELIEYLGVQLSEFEENFSKYMVSITEHNGEYVKRSFSLLGTMLADSRPEAEGHNPETTVLTFNYTNPFKGSIGKSEAVRIINVHGSLDKGIIFGIDGTRLADNPLVYPFSKTFRVMTAGTDFGEGAVRTEDGSLLSRATRVIKFFGHSLGEADYAYFQAVFDSVNLYASETKLVFYYKPHYKPGMDAGSDQMTKNRARNTMVGRVTRLLAEYGKTLDNEDHGKNLMHKLMIEGRLEVRLLQDEE